MAGSPFYGAEAVIDEIDLYPRPAQSKMIPDIKGGLKSASVSVMSGSTAVFRSTKMMN